MDIARDAKQMTGQGRSLAETRLYIDATYGHFGPGTLTPPVEPGNSG